MKFRIRALKIVIKTANKNLGVSFSFETKGLNIIRAENSKGKSTIYNSILYGLGLEMLIGNTRHSPLTYILNSYVPEGENKLPIIESYILLEVENESGDIRTIKRLIVPDDKSKLVEVLDGPCLTNPAHSPNTVQQYHVRLGGSAQNERGFHYWFARYLGWELPMVQRFSQPDSILFVECIFPLFIIEQKKGWTQIQASVPQYGIKDVKQRALEFALRLDSEKNNSKRREILNEISSITLRWNKALHALNKNIREINGRVENIPGEPKIGLETDSKPIYQVSNQGVWISLENKIISLKDKMTDLSSKISTDNPQNKTEQQAKQLDSLQDEVFRSETFERTLSRKHNEATTEAALLQKRISSLADDIRQMEDAFKISKLTGVAQQIESIHSCPVCNSNVDGSTLSQDVHRHLMTVEENLKFLKDELKAVEFLERNNSIEIQAVESEIQSARAFANDLREKIRNIKKSLVEDDRLPSTALLHEKVELEYEIKKHHAVLDECNQEYSQLLDLSKEFGVLREELGKLPKGLSETDEEKISQLSSTLKAYLIDFGFGSFGVDALDISRDTLQPVVEDFDWYFQSSGSDNIRAIWAYTLALLSVSKSFNTNHLGFLMYDEPKQHSAKGDSLKSFLGKASTLCGQDSQIIITTSESIASLNSLLTNIPVKKMFLDDGIRLIAETT